MSRTVSASKGAVLVVGMRWTDRLVGLLSTIILARLLLPEDFGIIAMASIVIGLVDVLLDVGVNVALIQNRNATQDDYDAAFTLRLLQSLAAAAIVVAVAGPAAAYFKDPRVTDVIRVLAIALLLAGLENIGTVTFQKKREFGVEFRYLFLRRLCGFAVTMVAAWLMRSYWALVVGTLAARVAGIGLSYAMHPMRPRLSFARVRPLLSFSTWNLLRGIAGYMNENLHRFVVGGRESTAVMGSYSLGSEIAALPTTELLAPLSRVLFPMFVELRDNAAKLKRAFVLALGTQTLVAIPAAVGLAIVARDLVLALLGEKWLAAVPFLQIIAAVNIVVAIGSSGGFLLLALGRTKLTALNAWTAVIVFVILAMLVFPAAGASQVALLRLAVGACLLGVLFLYVRRALPTLRWRELAGAIWRPCVASAAMALLVASLPVDELPSLVTLAIRVLAGALAYGVIVLVLWRLSGCPDGAETYLLEKARLAGLAERIVGRPLR